MVHKGKGIMYSRVPSTTALCFQHRDDMEIWLRERYGDETATCSLEKRAQPASSSRRYAVHGGVDIVTPSSASWRSTGRKPDNTLRVFAPYRA